MNLAAKTILSRLGSGATIVQVCADAGISQDNFQALWRGETKARIPNSEGTRRAAVRAPVQIIRDRWGIPHIQAKNDEDLFFGFGYAMAQDRLFQLDYLRRRSSGRLAEILGPDGCELDLLARVVGIHSVFEMDLLARTVGIRRIAEREWVSLAEEVRVLVAAFSDGINAQMEKSRQSLPIEFDLLDYQPEPWSPIDCLTIEGEFRWYLTGRFPVIVIPELAKRLLGNGPKYRAFLQVEHDQESILPSGSYPTIGCGTQKVGVSVSEPESALGSNNWVVAGTRTLSGKPLLASDPHIAFDAVSCWYEAHLCGGSFNVAGAAYVGMPAILFGRNPNVAWGCTNNICSQRDLYQERTDPGHPNCFLHDGHWEPAREIKETIHIKGGQPVQKTIRYSRNGPIVDEVLPPIARQTGPVSLKWLGASAGGWLTALLGMNRADSAKTFRQSLRPWHVPTFSVVYADVAGHIGYQATGRIPLRKIWERGYRPGWDPDHQWQDLIPFEGMPHLADPEQGWIATANNRPAPEDFPYPLSGVWSDGLRASRLRELLENNSGLDSPDFTVMQQDSLSLRAIRCLPGLLQALASGTDRRQQEAARHLADWDCRMEPNRVGATLFDVFFSHWTKTVTCERFAADQAEFLAGGANGLAAALLNDDTADWFTSGRRLPAIQAAMDSALDWLTQRLGADISQWTWRRIHRLKLRHILSGRGDLGQLLDHGDVAVPGDWSTVCNTGLGSFFEARTGANYRLIADLSTSPPALLSVDSQSHSGQPGSPNYNDQLSAWLGGQYHMLVLNRDGTAKIEGDALILVPAIS